MAIRHEKFEFAKDLVNLIKTDPEIHNSIDTLDLENEIEFATPYMFAVLRGAFDLAELLLSTGKVNKYYRNQN